MPRRASVPRKKKRTPHKGEVLSKKRHLPRSEALGAVLLACATFVAYFPALSCGYVWDDNLHLLNNPVLTAGGLARTWVPGTYINY